MMMSNKEHFTREDLLKVIHSWKIMISRNGEKYPDACLNDLKHSIDYVLEKEGVIDDYE